MVMSEQVNPYDLFLDLDTGTQKPPYYELLGVLPDEQDENVIARGCEQALAKVRRYKPGDNVQVWLSILDEISNAKTTLTDVEQRRVYDQQLETGELPTALEFVTLAGPVEFIAPANVAAAEAVPRPFSEELVPSHLIAENHSPAVPAEPIAIPVANSVSSRPPIPVAAEVPVSVGANVGEQYAGRQSGAPLSDNPGFLLDNGGSNSPTGGNRTVRRRSNRSGMPVGLIVAGVLVLVAISIVFGPRAFQIKVEIAQTDGEEGSSGSTGGNRNRDEKASSRPTEDNQKEVVSRQPVRRDPGTGDNPLKPLPSEFGKPDQSKPEKPESEPRQPEKPEVKPMAEAPVPEPLTAKEKAVLQKALLTARLALAERNFDVASQQLAIASPVARTEESAEAAARLKLMFELVTQFDRLASQAIDGYQAGSEINVGSSTKVVVVEVSPEELTIKIQGMVRTYRRKHLSVGLALGIAQTNFDDPVMTPFMKAAYLVTLKGDRYQKQAREFWLSGNANSARIPDDAFDKFVGDKYEF